MYSIGAGIEKIKALVDTRADVNHKTKSARTVAINALMDDKYPEYAHYFIVEKKLKVTEPYYTIYGNQDPDEEFYPVDLLRYWVFDLEKEEI